MRKLLTLASATVLCLAQPALAQSTDDNYAGYIISWDGTHPMTQVSGCYTIPQIVLGTTVDPTHQFNFNAEWVGLGGVNPNTTLAQTGQHETISTASTYAQAYAGFFATGAGGGGVITPGAYKPGDIICANVTCTLNCTANSTTATVTATQNDCPQTLPMSQCIAATTGSPGGTNWTFSQTLVNVHCDFKSAEWIEENVSFTPGGALYPYAAYGFVPFRDATCEEPGASGQCGGSSPVNPAFATSNQVNLLNGTGNAYPSAPVATTDGFNVCYSASVTITCDNVAGLQNSGGDFTSGF